MTKPRSSVRVAVTLAAAATVVLSLSSNGALPVAAIRDHLIPMGGEIDPLYLKTIRRNLFVTEADYGRVTTLTGGGVGERSIAIHSERASTTGVTMTCTLAERNLGASIWQSSGKVARGIKVKRADIPISRRTADLVRAAIQNALSNTAERTITGRASDVVFHGLQLIFSIENRSGRTESLLSPDSFGKRGEALYALNATLYKYCQSPPGGRQKIGRKIEKDTSRVLALK
jgi:hypothetical protein